MGFATKWAMSGRLIACMGIQGALFNVRSVEIGPMSKYAPKLPTKCPDCRGAVRVYAQLEVPMPHGKVHKIFAKCWTCRRRWVQSKDGPTTILSKYVEVDK